MFFRRKVLQDKASADAGSSGETPSTNMEEYVETLEVQIAKLEERNAAQVIEIQQLKLQTRFQAVADNDAAVCHLLF